MVKRLLSVLSTNLSCMRFQVKGCSRLPTRYCEESCQCMRAWRLCVFVITPNIGLKKKKKLSDNLSIMLNPLGANEMDPDPSCRFSREKHESWTHVLNFYVYAEKTVRKTFVEWIVGCFFFFFCEAEHGQQGTAKVKSNLPTGGRAASEHNPSRCWRFRSTRRAWAAAAGPSPWRRGYRAPDARRPLPWWWPDLQTCFSLSPSSDALVLQVSTLPRKICFLSPSCRSKISWKRRQGSRRRVGMCNAPHAGNEVLPPPKKSTKQERLWEQWQRWRRDPGREGKGGGLTSDVRSDLHPELQLHTRIYAQLII